MVATGDGQVPVVPVQSRPSAFQLALPGMLIACVCLLPFLNKPYTIDDPWFLLEARQILKTPFQPMSFPICWSADIVCPARAGQFATLQGLMGYLLLPTALADGEWIAHALQILFGCIAIFSMVKLALRLGFSAMQSTLAGVLLAAIPPFLPMANTAMPDVAALMLAVTGIERLLAWKDEQLWSQAAIASLTLGLAPYARPHLAALLVVAALLLVAGHPFRDRDRRSADVVSLARLLLPIAVAGGLLIAVNFVTRDRGPGDPIRLNIGFERLPQNLYAYLVYLSFPIPLTFGWLGVRWRKHPLLLTLPALLVAILHFLVFPSENIAGAWPIAAALYSVLALYHMAFHFLHQRDWRSMILLLWVLIPVPLVVYHQLPIKYLLPVMPAVILLLLGTLSVLPERRQKFAGQAMAVVGVIYSCLLLTADADFAGYGKKAAAELVAPQVAAGNRVWYVGSWGFYWYAKQAGGSFFNPAEARPRPGDLLAIGWLEDGIPIRDRFPNRELVDSRRYDSPHGRTMGFGGGLYNNGFGKALWVWNPEAVNVYELWRLR